MSENTVTREELEALAKGMWINPADIPRLARAHLELLEHKKNLVLHLDVLTERNRKLLNQVALLKSQLAEAKEELAEVRRHYAESIEARTK